MRNKFIYLLIISITFYGCKLRPYKKDKGFTKEDIKFMLKTYGEFVDKIPDVKLPLSVDCANISPVTEDSLLEAYQPFAPVGYEIVGKVNTEKDLYMVLCKERTAPKYLQMYITTLTGSNITWVKLYNDTCSFTHGSRTYSTTLIKSDNEIQIVDSTLYGHSHGRTIHADSTVIITEIISIDKKGNVKRKSSRRKLDGH